MMAMRELKLPMLKHSRATSMKNSMTRARCFFFVGCSNTETHKIRPEDDMVVVKVSIPRGVRVMMKKSSSSPLTMQTSVATR